MNIIKRLTQNRKEIFKGKNTCEFLTVHHTGSSQTAWQKMLRFFQIADYLSVHYIVGREGEIIQYVADEDVAFHAGYSSWKGRTNMNMHSIGIEIMSNGHDYTDKQREAVVILCRGLMTRHEIPKENVLRHADISGYRGKWDVGPAMFEPRWGSWLGFQNALSEDKWEIQKEVATAWAKKMAISNGERQNDMISRVETYIMLHRLYKKLKGLE